MKREILKIRLQTELDIVLAQKRAKQLGDFTGLNLATQTKFATAVSEICRNVFEHVGEGFVYFHLLDNQNETYVEAQVIDFGRGIADLDRILQTRTSSHMKGSGIRNSRKLVDFFDIQSVPEQGTKVTLRNKLPAAFQVNASAIKTWKDYFAIHENISPYEVMKNQNMGLIEMTEMLNVKNEEVEAKLMEIKRLNRELDQFAYIVSHDLKAPLRLIEGLVEALEDSLNESDVPDALQCAAMIRDRTEFMSKLIQDILAYSKIGRKHIPKAPVEVESLVKEVIANVHVPPHLEIHLEANLPTLNTEEILLYQVFSNLISNAIRYHDKSSGFIKIGSHRENDQYVFSVADNGPGISEQAQKKIFELFETLGEQKDSSGVGLSIVQNIARLKNAKLWVESDGHSGSTFYFSWPVEEMVQVYQN